jgi:SAM-dependent methyltransferase
MSLQEYFDANKANWDERVPIHTRSKSYDMEGFLAGNLAILPVDIREMGDVEGKTLLHLQCHFGMDTLSWSRLGAKVTGLDFSPNAVATATELAATIKASDARFVESNVYDAPTALGGEQFDIVYTGIGALCWLPKIRPWAKVVADCLKPGGTFYIREGHPVLWSLDDVRTEPEYIMRYAYFETEEPLVWDEGITYTDNDTGLAITSTRTYEWNHGLGEVVTALIEAGLEIEFVHEHDRCDWQALPWMVPDGERQWMLPEADQRRVPLTYSLRAHKPA